MYKNNIELTSKSIILPTKGLCSKIKERGSIILPTRVCVVRLKEREYSSKSTRS